MDDPRGAKAPAGIAQSIIGARKPPYHDNVMDHIEEALRRPNDKLHTNQRVVGGGGNKARATLGEEVLGSNPAEVARSPLVGSVSVHVYYNVIG